MTIFTPIAIDTKDIFKDKEEFSRIMVQKIKEVTGVVAPAWRGQWGLVVSLAAREAVLEEIERGLKRGVITPKSVLIKELVVEDFVLDDEYEDEAPDGIDIWDLTDEVLETSIPQIAAICRMWDRSCALEKRADELEREAAAYHSSGWPEDVYNSRRLREGARKARALAEEGQRALFQRAAALWNEWDVVPNWDLIKNADPLWWERVYLDGYAEDLAWPTETENLVPENLWDETTREGVIISIIRQILTAPAEEQEAAILAASKALRVKI